MAGEVVAWMDEKHAWPTHRAPKEPGTYALVLASDYEALLAERDALYDLLFDGYRVYGGLSDQAKARTSVENVSDTLDAFARLYKAATSAEPLPERQGGEG